MEELPKMEQTLLELQMPTPVCPHCQKKHLTRTMWVNPELSNGESHHELVLECKYCHAVFQEGQ